MGSSGGLYRGRHCPRLTAVEHWRAWHGRAQSRRCFLFSLSPPRNCADAMWDCGWAQRRFHGLLVPPIGFDNGRPGIVRLLSLLRATDDRFPQREAKLVRCRRLQCSRVYTDCRTGMTKARYPGKALIIESCHECCRPGLFDTIERHRLIGFARAGRRHAQGQAGRRLEDRCRVLARKVEAHAIERTCECLVAGV
jgi:hypothetical protein